MNPIKEIKLALIVRRTLNAVRGVNMKFSVNMVLQVCALLVQGLNQVGQLGLGPKANTYVSIGLTVTQAVIAVLAHFATPPNATSLSVVPK